MKKIIHVFKTCHTNSRVSNLIIERKTIYLFSIDVSALKIVKHPLKGGFDFLMGHTF